MIGWRRSRSTTINATTTTLPPLLQSKRTGEEINYRTEESRGKNLRNSVTLLFMFIQFSNGN